MDAKLVSRRRLAGAALFGLAIAASFTAGSPDQSGLPDVALGWPLLLHFERAAVAVGILGLISLVIWRAGQGEFPVRFWQIEYEVRGTAEELDLGIELLESRIVRLEEETGVSRGRVVRKVDEG